MAYDEDLADRIRMLLARRPGLTERRMFGGLAFLVDGALAVSASGQGGLMVRVDPVRADELLRHEGAARCVMRGREMNGWLRVSASALESTDALRMWVETGVARAAPSAASS